MNYLVIKWIHILSSTILFGTGLGSAFYMFMANRRKDISGIYLATRHVVLADWVFTTPAVLIQFITGVCLLSLGGYSLTEFWVMAGIGLYFFAGACWLPVVWMQLQMRTMAEEAFRSNTPLPERYWKMDRWWIILGALAFPAVVVIFYLMVLKP
jgi:uncharacterized membrane protein